MSQKTIKDIRVLHSEINKQQLNSSYFRLLHSRSSTHFPDLTYGHQFVSHMSCSSWLVVIKMSHSGNMFFSIDGVMNMLRWCHGYAMSWGPGVILCATGCHIVTRTRTSHFPVVWQKILHFHLLHVKTILHATCSGLYSSTSSSSDTSCSSKLMLSCSSRPKKFRSTTCRPI